MAQFTARTHGKSGSGPLDWTGTLELSSSEARWLRETLGTQSGSAAASIKAAMDMVGGVPMVEKDTGYEHQGCEKYIKESGNPRWCQRASHGHVVHRTKTSSGVEITF